MHSEQLIKYFHDAFCALNLVFQLCILCNYINAFIMHSVQLIKYFQDAFCAIN